MEVVYFFKEVAVDVKQRCFWGKGKVPANFVCMCVNISKIDAPLSMLERKIYMYSMVGKIRDNSKRGSKQRQWLEQGETSTPIP